MTVLSTLIIEVIGDITNAKQKLTEIGANAQETGERISGIGRSMTTGFTLPLVGAGVAVTKFSNEFNAGLANVASLGGEASAIIGQWKPQLQDMAIAVGKTTGDMSEGMYNVVSAFGVADDSLLVLDINARAATAGLSTTTDAINLTSAVTKGYGDTSAESVQSVADLALLTVQLGQTTFPQLASSIGRVTPLAASLGVTQQELFGVMATGTGVTGGAAEVSTQLRGVLQSLMAPTGDMTKLIKGLGFESGQALLQQEGLQGTINMIVQAAEASGTPLQKFIGSIEGQTLAMALAGPQADTFTEKLAAMEDASGALDEAFAAQTEGVNKNGFQLQQLGIKAQVTAQRLGDALAPAISKILDFAQPLLDKITSLAQRFAEMNPHTQMIVVGALGLVAALGPLLMIVGPLVSGFGLLVSAVGLLFGPLGLVIGAAVGLYVAFQNNFFGIRDVAGRVLDWLSGRFAEVAAIFEPLITGVTEFVGGVVEQFQTGGLQGAIQAVKDLFPDLKLSVTESLGNLVEGISGMIGVDLVGVFTSLQEKASLAWETIRTTAVEMWGELQPKLEDLVAKVQELTGQVVSFVSDVVAGFQAGGLSGAADVFIGLFVSIRQQVGQAITDLVQMASDKIGIDLFAVFQKIRDVSVAVWTFIRSVIVATWQTLQPVFLQLREVVASVSARFSDAAPTFQRFVTAIRPIATLVGTVIVGALLSFLGTAVSVFSGVINAIDPFVKTAINIFEGFTTFLEGLVNLVSGVVNFIIALFQGNTEGVLNAFNQMQLGVGQIAVGIQTMVTSAFFGLVETVGGFIDGFAQSIIGFFQNLYTELVGASIVPDMVNGIIAWIDTMVTDVLLAIGNWVIGFVAKIVELKDQAINKIVETVTQIKEVFTSTDWSEMGKGIIDGVISGIKKNLQNLISAAKDMLRKAYDAAKEAIGFSSPAKLFIPMGQSIPQAVGVGMLQEQQQLQRTMQNVVRPLPAVAQAALPSGAGAGGGGGDTFNIDMRNSNIYGINDLERQLDRIINKHARQAEVYKRVRR